MIHEMWGGKVGKTKQEVTNTHVLICIMDGWEGKKEVKKKTQRKTSLVCHGTTQIFLLLLFFLFFYFFPWLAHMQGQTGQRTCVLIYHPDPKIWRISVGASIGSGCWTQPWQAIWLPDNLAGLVVGWSSRKHSVMLGIQWLFHKGAASNL